MTAPTGTSPDLLHRDAAAFMHQDGSSPCIGVIRGARGGWIELEDGRRLLDLHGNSAHHIGYAHPRLVAAVKQQIDSLAFSPRRFANETATLLAETLTARFRPGHSRVLLAPCGSDAVEIALRLARVATGRSGIVALEGSYHGHGFASLALGTARPDPRLGSQLPDIHHVTPYWDVAGGGADRMLADIERALHEAKGGIACIIAEPMRSNCVVPPAGLWPAVAALASRHGTRLVFDEIPSGLGKTGRFFAHEHYGVTPDAVVLGKALGGGLVPIAAVIADSDLSVAPDLSLGHYTHEKNPVTACAALTTLQIIDDEGLVAAADRLGRYAETRLRETFADHPAGDAVSLRGLGLLRCADFGAMAAFGPEDAADRLVDAAFAHRMSTTAKGRDAIGFSPALVVSEAEIDDACLALRAAFDKVAADGPVDPARTEPRADRCARS
ncbi:MAG: aminotransferase class III-fold pyridoxal phosphate-dependent enzyme [Alsobacter sp.]